MGMKYDLLLIGVLTTAFSCIEPFEIGSLEHERVLVVDGLITDEEKAHVIRLSYTYPVGEEVGEPEPATQAEVWMTDRHNTTYSLSEAGPGRYHTTEDFKAVPGNAYVLNIRLREGQEYRSNPEVLIPSPAIDRLYGRYLQKPNAEGEVENGVQLLLDTGEVNDSINYFRYELEETYRVSVPLPSTWRYSDFSTDPVNPRIVFEKRDEPLDTCYVQNVSENIQLTSIAGRSEHRVAEFPIRFLNETSRHLNERYFISIRQYAISENTLSFYRQLKDNRELTGSLFDKQPGRIQGNMQSVNDPGEIVLGYFEVSGVSVVEQYFVPEPFYEAGLPPFEWDFSTCTSGNTVKGAVTFYLNDFPDHLITSILGNDVFLTDKVCSDCRIYGDGTLQRPEFWME